MTLPQFVPQPEFQRWAAHLTFPGLQFPTYRARVALPAGSWELLGKHSHCYRTAQSDGNQMGQALDEDNANRKRTQGCGKKEKQQKKFLKS